MQDSFLLERFRDTQIFDLTQHYSEFVPFTVNSVYPVHRWYRFKEGFSRDLVHLILGSFGACIDSCLDPFAGSGTTPLACQEVGIVCHSIEVNPFLHHVSKAKLDTGYSSVEFDKAIVAVQQLLDTCIDHDFDEPSMSTITEGPTRDKWLFHRSVLQAILALRHCLAQIDVRYSDLLLVVLASILVDVGNTTKDGKCVRYKKNWRESKLSRRGVCNLFFERARLFRQDILYLERKGRTMPRNVEYCKRASAITELSGFSDASVDAVITSPPYLNSFDYTDVYMPELWSLGFVENYAKVRELRAETLRSHVQVKWETKDDHLNEALSLLVDEVVTDQDLWNQTIPDMIRGYFLDMQKVLTELGRILRPGGKLCIVVGTSSYNKVVIPTDLLIADLAANLGFAFEEMRIIRQLKRSTKQTTEDGKALPPLRESLLVLTAPESLPELG